MLKSVGLAAAGAILASGYMLASAGPADAGCRKHRHHHHYGHHHRHHGVIYAPRVDYRVYYPREYYWKPYRPAYVYYPATYPVRYGYGPVCERWGWIYNRYGDARWRCISW